MRSRRTALLCATAMLAALLSGCGTSEPSGPAAGAAGAGATGSVDAAQPAGATPAEGGCPAGADYPAGPGHEAHEVVGGGAGVSLWALLFLTGGELTAGTETKIVWRMTGSGAPTMRATGPAGTEITPAWGPETHGGSTWHRPGDEWGAGWLFPTAGCWTMHATRAGGASAQLVLRVAPA